MRSLHSQTFSLTLGVSPRSGSGQSLLDSLHGCIRTVEGVQRNPGRTDLRNVQVSVEVAHIGCYLSDPGPSLDACKALEGALLLIPNSRIRIHAPTTSYEREGRAEFWRPVFERAFPRLNKQGRLSLPSGALITVRATCKRSAHPEEIIGVISNSS